jgi:glycosyltransferase involved in cell wall biosynthesis
MMQFSIVIPTRNRLNLLSEAIETVRLQSYQNWELIIFDNASDDKNEILFYLNELKDSRIKYYRSNKFLSVTNSWNNAINKANGDYITLIGDDDGLCPNYFESISKAAHEMNFPDLIYNAFYQFWHPGVAPWEPRGHLIEIKHGFFYDNQEKPFLMSRSDSLRAINDSLNFNISFSFNSQACVYKKSFFNKIKDGNDFYQSPYPDFYIANVALFMSESTAVIPNPIAIAGVSKSSVGYTIYNYSDSVGEAILNNDLFSDVIFNENKNSILPGSAYNTNYFLAMKYVEKKLVNFKNQFNIKKYRKIQLYDAIAIINDKKDGGYWSQLSILEKLWSTLILWSRGSDGEVYRGRRFVLMLKRIVHDNLKKQIFTSGCDPKVRQIGFFNTTCSSEIFKVLDGSK